MHADHVDYGKGINKENVSLQTIQTMPIFFIWYEFWKSNDCMFLLYSLFLQNFKKIIDH